MENVQDTKKVDQPTQAGTQGTARPQSFSPRRSTGPSRGGPRRDSKDRQPRERVKPEFDTKIISIRRVTRVASGGRRFSFSVAIVAGNRKGQVGVGMGKAVDTALAIDKATRDAKKNMITVPLTKNFSIAHPVEAKYCSSRIMIMPTPGRGMVAGSSARNVLELAGVKDVGAKLFSGSKNKVNNARVAIEALSMLSRERVQAAKAE